MTDDVTEIEDDIPTTLAEALRSAADWLDLGDKAMELVAWQSGEDGYRAGKDVQRDLRSVADYIESAFPIGNREIWLYGRATTLAAAPVAQGLEQAAHNGSGEGSSPSRRTFDASLPCPQCGKNTILGYLFTNDAGEHMHTHYVCTHWPSGGTRCGWHGWSVPGWDTVDDES